MQNFVLMLENRSKKSVFAFSILVVILQTLNAFVLHKGVTQEMGIIGYIIFAALSAFVFFK